MASSLHGENHILLTHYCKVSFVNYNVSRNQI